MKKCRTLLINSIDTIILIELLNNCENLGNCVSSEIKMLKPVGYGISTDVQEDTENKNSEVSENLPLAAKSQNQIKPIMTELTVLTPVDWNYGVSDDIQNTSKNNVSENPENLLESQIPIKPTVLDDICSTSDEYISETTCSEYEPSYSDESCNNFEVLDYCTSPEIREAEPLIWKCVNSNNIQEALDTQTLQISKNRANVSKNQKQIKETSRLHTKRLRRKHNCPYCDNNVGNFARHLERNHDNELAVQELLNLKKKSKKRKKLIDKLRREGDFCTSNVIPVMCLEKKGKEEYIVCKFCYGYYSRKSLRRHAKKCFFNPNPSQRFNAQIEGQTIMSGNFGPKDVLRTSGLLNMLQADKVALVVKRDFLICEVARKYIRSHKENHLLLVAKRKMRRLGRLLLSAREISKNETLKLIDILTPSKFKLIVTATKNMSGYDEKERSFKSPSLALQMGTLIKSATNTAYSMEIQKDCSSSKRLDELKSLITLIETDWAHEVSSEAGQNLAINKFNKPILIPAAEDVAVSTYILYLCCAFSSFLLTPIYIL